MLHSDFRCSMFLLYINNDNWTWLIKTGAHMECIFGISTVACALVEYPGNWQSIWRILLLCTCGSNFHLFDEQHITVAISFLPYTIIFGEISKLCTEGEVLEEPPQWSVLESHKAYNKIRHHQSPTFSLWFDHKPPFFRPLPALVPLLWKWNSKLAIMLTCTIRLPAIKAQYPCQWISPGWCLGFLGFRFCFNSSCIM